MILKVTNVTHRLPKKHKDRMKGIEFSYTIKFKEHTSKVGPKSTAYISVQSVPKELRELKMKGLVEYIELTEHEYNKEIVSKAEKKVKVRKKK